MRMRTVLLAATITTILTPLAAYGQVVITEVMYDLEGGDADREWVEIHNKGGVDIDLAGWRFYENDTNHRLENENGMILAAGARAVIADDPALFRSDWPDVAALVVNSSFSLKNTGEYIAIKDPDGNEIDGLTYAPQSASDGTSASLQYIDGAWQAARPTPGEANAESGSTDTKDTNTTSDTDSAQQNTNVGSPTPEWDEGRDIDVRIIELPERVIVGASARFAGRALGFEGEPLKNAHYSWSFGDGGREEGEHTTYHYRYPGEYVVVLRAASGEYSARDKRRITAVPADLSLSAKSGNDGFIAVANNAAYELDISKWHLYAGKKRFTVPRYTFIAPNITVRFAAETTGLVVTEPAGITLRYPNGAIAAAHTQADAEQTETGCSDCTADKTQNPTSAQPVPQMTSETPPETSYTPLKEKAHTARSPKTVVFKNTMTRGGVPNKESRPQDTEPPATGTPSNAGSQEVLVLGARGEDRAGSDITWWLLAVAGVAGIAAVGTLVARRMPAEDTTVRDEAAQYEFIEAETGTNNAQKPKKEQSEIPFV